MNSLKSVKQTIEAIEETIEKEVLIPMDEEKAKTYPDIPLRLRRLRARRKRVKSGISTSINTCNDWVPRQINQN